MLRLRIAVARAVLALTLACSFVGVAVADTTLSGQTSGGAYYQIVVPDSWNGDLVLWNHGYTLTPGAPNPDLGPLRDVQLAEGYAVAASSYRDVGWAVFKSDKDLENLYKVFKNEFGAPDRVFLNGGSLGGIVTAQALEQAKLGNVVGAYPFCGALSGSRLWDGALDLRLTYDAVCDAVPGGALPGGAMGLPDGSTRTLTDNILSVNACFGILLPPPARTPGQAARLAQFLTSTQIPENFVITDIAFYGTFGMRDLWDKLGGKLGMGNANVVYPDPVIDATIERVTPNNGARNKLRQHYTPDGDVGNVKIVSIHTDKDGLVLVENENEYAQVVAPSQLTVGVVVEAVPTHCGFTPAELVAGWEALRGWVGGLPQPTAVGLQGLCLALEPAFGGPCRIDPFFVVPDMDGRVLPRNDEDSDSDSDSDSH